LAYCRLTICGLGGLLEPLGGKDVGLGGLFKDGLGGLFEFGLGGLYIKGGLGGLFEMSCRKWPLQIWPRWPVQCGLGGLSNVPLMA